MARLTQFKLCPHSRSIRLALAEHGLDFEMVEEHAWEWRQELLDLNPSGELPVLEMGDGIVVCGAYAIAEYVAEDDTDHHPGPRGLELFPGGRAERAEVRRLVHWFNAKLDREVTQELLAEKVYPRIAPRGAQPVGRPPPAPPDPATIRSIRENLRYHLTYVDYLAEQRRWLAGEEPSFADLAAAAQLSTIDFLGEVPWDAHPGARLWFQRVKSRPSFRPLLADRLPGFMPPPHYADLDF